MKATLEFSLPDEQEEHQDAIDGIKWKCIVLNLDNWLREQVKYNNKESLPVDDIRSKLRELSLDKELHLL